MQRRDSFKDYISELPNFLSIFQCSFFTFSLSSILLDVSRIMKINVGTLNLIFTFNIIGNFAGNILSPVLNRKFSRTGIITIFYTFLIADTIGLFLASNVTMLYLFYFLAGFIIGIIWVQANGLIQASRISSKEKLTTVAYIFFPAGALMGPLVAVNIIKNNINWKCLYIVILIFVILTFILYVFITRKKEYLSESGRTENISISKVFEDKSVNLVFLLLLLLMLFFGAAEVSISTWSPTFLRVERAFLITSAGWAISAYWMAVGFGRILISSVSGKFKTDYLLLVLSIVSFTGIALFVFAPSSIIIFIGVILAGIGLSGIQPLATAKGSRVLSKGIGYAISMLSASAALGGSIGPYLIKYISSKSMLLSMSTALIFSFSIIIILVINVISGIRREIKINNTR